MTDIYIYSIPNPKPLCSEPHSDGFRQHELFPASDG